jgi:hypothetical protein
VPKTSTPIKAYPSNAARMIRGIKPVWQYTTKFQP